MTPYKTALGKLIKFAMVQGYLPASTNIAESKEDDYLAEEFARQKKMQIPDVPSVSFPNPGQPIKAPPQQKPFYFQFSPKAGGSNTSSGGSQAQYSSDTGQ